MSSAPQIVVTPHGPYRISGEVRVHDEAGNLVSAAGPTYLCRCGGSRSKPFCDATHAAKRFDGQESASHDTAARGETYQSDGLTVQDDRTRCAHFGQCTDRLPRVFRADAEPFVDLGGSDAMTIADVVAGCPSGALSLAPDTDRATDPDRPGTVEPASITATTDGPYRVRGHVQVIDAQGRRYEARSRQALCRCGQSRNKPFCDGSHWYAGFRDPVPPEVVVAPPTLLEWAGGTEALERLAEAFYATVLTRPDPVLEPVFRGMSAEHPRHVAAWLTETFGGPAIYTERHGGYEHMLAKHRDLGLTQQQRRRWLTLMLETADDVGLPDDPEFRSAFVAYLEWGTRLAVDNSQPDADVMPHAPVPRWGWGQTPPCTPQPWDDPEAAARGRAQYAQAQAQAGPAATFRLSETVKEDHP